MVLQRATDLDRVLFTRDDDMLRLATAWCQRGDSFSGVIYSHQLRVTIGQCVTDLTTLVTAGVPGEFADRVRYLPLR